MKYIIFTLILFISGVSLAQRGFDTNETKTNNSDCKCCTDKTKNVDRRYGAWQCGRSDSIVDCNEKLEYDENTNTVIHRLTGKPFTGYCETCHMNGTRERLIYFVNGKDEGVDTTRYKTGCPKVARSMLDGVQDGPTIFYYDSTRQIAWKENFAFGKKHGQQIYFDKDHKTKKIEHYYDGILHGNKKTFFPGTFSVRFNANYKMNVLHGVYESYVQNDTGSVMVISYNYENGIKEGQQETFYDNGATLTTEEYKKGKKHGPATTFFLDGTIMKSENWNKGLQDGEFKMMYPDGKTQWEAEYKKGKLLHETHYDKFGNPIEPEKPEGEEAEPEEETGKKKKKKKKKKKRKKKKKKKDKE